MDTDKETAFVLLKGTDEMENKQLSSTITKAIFEMKEADSSIEYFELNPSLAHYETFAATTGVETYPAVVVLGRGGNLSVLNNESVSSIKLYKAYVAATTPAASCNPAACKPTQNCKPTKACKPSQCTPAQRAKCGVQKSN